MVVEITLQNLMVFLVGTLGVVAGVFLLIILWDIKKIVGVLRPLVETNQQFVSETISTMPGIFENIEQISHNARETSDELKVLVPEIVQEVETITTSAKGSIELTGTLIEKVDSKINDIIDTYQKDKRAIMTYFHVFEEFVQFIYRKFSPSK